MLCSSARPSSRKPMNLRCSSMEHEGGYKWGEARFFFYRQATVVKHAQPVGTAMKMEHGKMVSQRVGAVAQMLGYQDASTRCEPLAKADEKRGALLLVADLVCGKGE